MASNNTNLSSVLQVRSSDRVFGAENQHALWPLASGGSRRESASSSLPVLFGLWPFSSKPDTLHLPSLNLLSSLGLLFSVKSPFAVVFVMTSITRLDNPSSSPHLMMFYSISSVQPLLLAVGGDSHWVQRLGGGRLLETPIQAATVSPCPAHFTGLEPEVRKG